MARPPRPVKALLGGVWISQTIPAVILGLYTRWFNPWALIAGSDETVPEDYHLEPAPATESPTPISAAA